jgi:hypothetical protein
MGQLTSAKPDLPVASEASTLAREMAGAYRDAVEFYRDQYRLPTAEALDRADAPVTAEQVEHALSCPADQVSWHDLSDLARQDPELAARRWEELKREARDELRSGHRAARAVDGYLSRPWKRARFLALREELAEGWQPRNGMERQLVDTMAQARADMLYWQGVLAEYTSLEASRQEHHIRKTDAWNPPRVSDAQAIEQAAAMVDRFNRVFIRTLRALRELRQYPPAVVVQSAGQVNVAGRQVNMSGASALR